MVEFKRTNKNRGFYVRMKFVNKQGRPDNGSYYRYFRWVLWVSLSLYFFSSYLITNSKRTTTLPKRTTVSSTSVSRALFETNTTVLQQHRIKETIFSQGLGDLKVYIYDLPSKYNSDWLSNKRCSTHLFAAEVAIHKALMGSNVRTLNPWDADFFFVPVYVSCNFSNENGFPSLSHARPLLASAIQLISEKMPFWNRSSGSDHVFVASHDYGACFHAMEDFAIADGIPEFLKKSIILQTFGVRFRHPCQEVENVLIPPYISPENVRSTLRKVPVNGKREIRVFFRGKMEVHPKNVSGRFYSKGLRTVIWQKFNRHKFYLKRHRFKGYQSEIARSVFCLCPLGWAPWSPRLVESVALGCVPVIIADGIRLPYSNTIQWPEISLTVAEKDIKKLGKILDHVASTNLTTIQRNLWDPANKRALLYNSHIQQGDATWQILYSLSKKLHRSYRQSRALTNELATRDK